MTTKEGGLRDSIRNIGVGIGAADPTIDNFEAELYEDQSLTLSDYYSGDLSVLTRSQSGAIFEGSYALVSDGSLGSAGATSMPGVDSDLPNYPARGDDVTAYVQINTSDDNARLHLFAETGGDPWNAGDNYTFEVIGSYGSPAIQIQRTDAGEQTPLGNDGSTVTEGKWYRMEISSTSSDLTFELVDPNDDSVVASVSVTDSTYDGQGVGWSRRNTGERFDLGEVDASDSGTTTTVYDDITSLSYVQSFDVEPSIGTNSVQGISVRDNGNRMWVPNRTPDPSEVAQFDLSTSWDVSTASLSGSIGVPDAGDNIIGMEIADSGTRFYVTDLSSGIHQYDLSTAYDITSASYVRSYTVTYLSESHPLNIDFYNNGQSALVGMGIEDDIVEYSLSTAYDISTLTQENTYDVQNDIAGDKLGEVKIRNNAEDVFTINGEEGSGESKIWHYTLSTPGDLSTISLKDSFDLTAQTNYGQGVAIQPEGEVAFVAVNNANDRFEVLEYRT